MTIYYLVPFIICGKGNAIKMKICMFQHLWIRNEIDAKYVCPGFGIVVVFLMDWFPD